MKIFFLFLICIAFQACDSGTKKTVSKVSLPKNKGNSISTLENIENSNVTYKTANMSSIQPSHPTTNLTFALSATSTKS